MYIRIIFFMYREKSQVYHFRTTLNERKLKITNQRLIDYSKFKLRNKN
jgi:hypothetical protein